MGAIAVGFKATALRLATALFLAGGALAVPSAGLHAQEPDTIPQRPARPGGFGGPKELAREMEVDNASREGYRKPIRYLRGWYDWKSDLQDRTGFQFNINYTSLYTSASHAIEEGSSTWAASGSLEGTVQMTLFGRESGNTGTLFTKVTNRHSIGSDRTPMFLGFETGYYGLPGTGYREFTTRMMELNWVQALLDQRFQFAVGKVDPINYLNFHGLVVPWRHYLGYGSSVSGTVNWPDPGWGVVASVRPHENIYIGGALTDARGDVFKDGDFLYGGNQFFEGNFFSAIEVGYVPSFDERYFRKVSLTFWRTPEFTEDGSEAVSEEASGWAFSSHWYLNDRYIPFFRLASSNGKGINAFYRTDVQLGTGFRFLNHDILGVSASWAEPNIPDAEDQFTGEVFYRFVITEHLELTPDLQIIFNPTLNPSESVMAYFGARVRMTF